MTRRWRIAMMIAPLILALSVAVYIRPGVVADAQERIFDRIVEQSSPSTPLVVVVDIGAQDETGAPWGRAATARLVSALAAANPKVIAFDMVFSGDCARNDANDALAQALTTAPSVLGFLLGERASLPPGPNPNLMVAGTPIWSASGAEGPCPQFSAKTTTAAISLFGDRDSFVRRLPAAVRAGTIPYPSLAVEAVRLSSPGLPPMLATGQNGTQLRLADHPFDADAEGQLRYVPTRQDHWTKRTLTANTVLRGGSADRITGAVVFVGSSLPQWGGLRPTAASPLHPSVQIQADLAEGLLSHRLPHRPEFAKLLEAAFVTVAGLSIVAAILVWSVASGLGLTAASILIWGAASVGLYRNTALLIDPALPGLAVGLIATSALTGKAWASTRAEQALRRKMSQLLPQPIITRLAEDPKLLRLKGEERIVTALFSDIEGFSATTKALGPEALVSMLDRYFTLTCDIVLRHGGMIDKIVGDSIHALFNAPLDLPDHVDAALACAQEIVAATEALRRDPVMQAAGLGRTRIGIETGPAILGDVGSGAKIDYTAHGDAVNLAARLEQANKDLGTAICIGPQAASQSKTSLTSLGEIDIRSFGRIPVYTV